MNITELAANRDEIMRAQDIDCPLCGKHQYSPFGKLYVKYADKCQDCTTDDDELLRNGEVLFQVVNG